MSATPALPTETFGERNRQHTVDLASVVGLPNVGDVLAVLPGCEQATITPGIWTRHSAGVLTHLVTETGLVSLLLTCPDDGHGHRNVQVTRSGAAR